MKTFQSLPSMRFNSEWKKTFINKYSVSKTDASSIKAVQEMWIRCLEKPRSSSICLWTGACSRANRLMQSYWFERSTPGRGKVWKKESWRNVLGITKFFVWCKVSLCTTFTMPHLWLPIPTYIIYEVCLKWIMTELPVSILSNDTCKIRGIMC